MKINIKSSWGLKLSVWKNIGLSSFSLSDAVKLYIFGGHKKKKYFFFEPILFNLLKQQTQQEQEENRKKRICVHQLDKGEEKAIVERGRQKKVTKQNCKNSIIKERKKNQKKSLMYVRGAKGKSMAYGHSNKQPEAVS